MTSKKEIFAPTDGTALVADDLADSLTSVGAAAGSGNLSYLKFNKAGQWVFGASNDEIDPDETLAINPASFTIGWQGWNDGMPVNGPTVPITQRNTLPAETDLEPIPGGEMNGWNKQLGVQIKSMSDGVDLQLNVTSYGGKKALTQLMSEIGLGLRDHPEAPVALVKLEGDKYKHKTYGWIHTPVIKVVGWADAEGKEVKKLAA